ncbi:hypothetical protein KP509_14G014800 [Ceratopteris richardii]|uniref:Uncharacterized protein n=1 Tax=Ceratopteris richardii TaxID=49495 RepID=A0A8T2T845_CERRI|nr:hypothetical protein KP509_14G014800 [Ceratopteris richardii]
MAKVQFSVRVGCLTVLQENSVDDPLAVFITSRCPRALTRRYTHTEQSGDGRKFMATRCPLLSYLVAHTHPPFAMSIRQRSHPKQQHHHQEKRSMVCMKSEGHPQCTHSSLSNAAIILSLQRSDGLHEERRPPTMHFEWQTVGLMSSYNKKSGQYPGPITLACLLSCTDDQLETYRGMHLAPTHVVPSIHEPPS